MRELTIRISFTTPCLGNDKKSRTVREHGKQKKRTHFRFSRTHEGKVILMPQWWQALMRDAAEVMGRLHREIKDIRFSLEVDGSPRPIPAHFYKRYYGDNKFSPHEAFFEGDMIGVSCLVPSTISDDEFWQLMDLAGKYYGISPARHGEFGRFKVIKIERRGPQEDIGREPPQTGLLQEPCGEEETVAPKN